MLYGIASFAAIDFAPGRLTPAPPLCPTVAGRRVYVTPNGFLQYYIDTDV
jgi:hypothetical protein